MLVLSPELIINPERISARFSSLYWDFQLYKHRAEQRDTWTLMDAYSNKSMSLAKVIFGRKKLFSYPSMPTVRTHFTGEPKKKWWTHYVAEISCVEWSRKFESRGGPLWIQRNCNWLEVRGLQFDLSYIHLPIFYIDWKLSFVAEGGLKQKTLWFFVRLKTF